MNADAGGRDRVAAAQADGKPATVTVVAAINVAQPDASVVHVVSLAAALAARGHTTTLLVPQPPTGDLAVPVPNSVVLRHSPSGRRWGLPNSVGFVLLLPHLLRLMLRGDAEVVYVRTAALSVLATGLARALRRSVVWSEHNGWIADELLALGQPAWTARVAGRTQAWDARLANRVRVVVPGLATTLQRAGVRAQKIVVIGNGTDVARLRPLDRSAAAAQAGIDPGLEWVGFAGNLTAWQGVELALTALARLAASRPDVRLLVAGDGPERARLEAAARRLGVGERVRWLGWVEAGRYAAVLNCFDVAIAPFPRARNARIGLSPLKLRDYAATGRPVVAAALPGIVEHEVEGWLVTHRPDDADDLAATVAELLDDDDRRQAMGRAGRAIAEASFGWEHVAAAIDEATPPL